MRQSRSGGVFGGLWQTQYVSGSNTTSPIGWDAAWHLVYKRGFGLGPHPAARGGRFRDLRQWRRGGCAKSGRWRVQGWSKKVFPPMTWGALSEARRVPPQETVIRGHGGDYCACRCNTSKYNINSYNTGSYRRYIQYRHIHTIQTHTYNGQPAKNNLLDLGARALSKVSFPRNCTCTF